MSIRLKLGLLLGSLFALLAASMWTTLVLVDAQKSDAVVMNTAGKLRVSSQRATKAALLGKEAAAEEHDAIQLFERGIDALEYGSPPLGIPKTTAPAIVSKLTTIRTHWSALRNDLTELEKEHAAGADPALIHQVAKDSVLVVVAANEAVTLYEAQTVARVSSTRSVLVALTIVGLLVFLLALRLTDVWILRRMTALSNAAESIARGDLAIGTLACGGGDEISRAARAFNTMVVRLRQIIQGLTDASVQLNSAAAEFVLTAAAQERGAANQSSAAERAEDAHGVLADTNEEIAATTRSVLEQAEKSEQTSQRVVERIGELRTQTQRIGEVLDIIRGIASKTELLALNASLEGTRAGDAGKGFSLVGAEMQRLAEHVGSSVREVQQVLGSIAHVASDSGAAVAEAARLATEVTGAARKIAGTVTDQNEVLLETRRATSEVAAIASEARSGAHEVMSAAQEVRRVSEHLKGMIDQFELRKAA